jgi:hypothetical protein
LIEPSGAFPAKMASSFVSEYMGEGFDGGFKIEWVRDEKGNPLPHTVNRTMMRVEMPKALKPGDKFVFFNQVVV